MHWRRLFQFRLRTLLIAATLLCVALAVVIEPARRQRQAVLELERRGATVVYESNSVGFLSDSVSFGPNHLPWSQTYLGCDFGQRIYYIEFPNHQSAFTERDWQLIQSCQPAVLGIGSQPYALLPFKNSERNGAWSIELRAVQHLSIANRAMTEQDLRHLVQLRHLRDLEFSSTSLTDSDLARLAALPELKWLTLDERTVTTEGVTKLRAALPRCKIQWSGEPAR